MIHTGDSLDILRTLPDTSVQCCVTSPPYWGLRDYGHNDQIGLEETPEQYVSRLVAVFAEVQRVLADDGVLWLNLGDSYASNPASRGAGKQQGGAHQHTPRAGYTRPAGLKPKDLVGIPWRVAFALQADGWYLRASVIWHKPSPMPESVRDRVTKAHENVFMLTKRARYFYDQDAIREKGSADSGWSKQRAKGKNTWDYGREGFSETRIGGMSGKETLIDGTRNARSVWTIPTQPFSGAHFAVMPPALADRCIRSGSRVGDTVLDPFSGAGTTGMVARRLRRQYVGIEINPEFADMARRRIDSDAPLLNRLAL